jgi:hypothetical protein
MTDTPSTNNATLANNSNVIPSSDDFEEESLKTDKDEYCSTSSGFDTDTDDDDEEDFENGDGDPVIELPPQTEGSQGSQGCYMRIKDRDFSTREIWCVHGAPLAVYPDGCVGPLRPLRACRRVSVVVCIDQDYLHLDNIDRHPDIRNAHDYALVVRVNFPLKIS